MQDRFKFRVWSNIAKKYIKDFHAPIGNDYQLVLTQNGELCELGLGDSDERNEHSWGSLKVFSDCIIQQCTGLKDKNGKLIYEGDIVTQPSLPHKVVCEWFQDGFWLNGFQNGAKRELRNMHNWYQVIGNIYENKELLEVNNAN